MTHICQKCAFRCIGVLGKFLCNFQFCKNFLLIINIGCSADPVLNTFILVSDRKGAPQEPPVISFGILHAVFLLDFFSAVHAALPSGIKIVCIKRMNLGHPDLAEFLNCLDPGVLQAALVGVTEFSVGCCCPHQLRNCIG